MRYNASPKHSQVRVVYSIREITMEMKVHIKSQTQDILLQYSQKNNRDFWCLYFNQLVYYVKEYDKKINVYRICQLKKYRNEYEII